MEDREFTYPAPRFLTQDGSIVWEELDDDKRIVSWSETGLAQGR